MGLLTFLQDNKNELLQSCMTQIRKDPIVKHRQEEIEQGMPIYYNQLLAQLAKKGSSYALRKKMRESAEKHGEKLFETGFSILEVVFNYDCLCENIMALAKKKKETFSPEEFHILNNSLDTVIAEAVSAFERRKSQKQAEESRENLGILVHELRNSLASATLSFHLIKSGKIPPQGKTADQVERSHIRMRNLIDKTIADIRLKTGQKPVFENIKLDDLIDEVISSMIPERERRGISFSVSIEPKIELMGDSQFLVSAVSNLIQNAFKYSKKEKHVELRSFRKDGLLQIEVEDSCGGLEEEKISELLEPFHRGNIKEENDSGLGLGLTIIQKSAKLHNGEFFIHNIPNKGCVMGIRLPLP